MSHAAQSSQHKSAASFGLERKVAEGRFLSQSFEFLTPFIGEPIDEADWMRYVIEKSEDGKFILSYAVSVQKRSLVIFNASLANKERPKERFTEMTLSEMILDSWIVEGQEPETLRFLGIWMVQNNDAEAQMIREFSESPEGLLHTDRMTLRPESPGNSKAFTDNIFLGCGLSLAKKLDRASAQNMVLKKADFLKAGADADDLVLYIVMQFGDRSEEEVADVMSAAVKSTSDSGLSDDGEDEVVFGGRRK